MNAHPLRVAQINTLDSRGGAAQVVWNLHRACRERDREREKEAEGELHGR